MASNANETVLIFGASGNIGVSVITAALRRKMHVLAVVRNQAGAAKLFEHVGTKEGITIVEADPTKETDVNGVVEKVKTGKLPAFQHVYVSVGTWNPTPLTELTTESFRGTINIALESTFFVYRTTIPYLLSQRHPTSTWTAITGAAAEYGVAGVTAVSQGGLMALLTVAMKDNANTNIRVNEVFLSARVDYDTVAEAKGRGVMKSSDFAKVYEGVLADDKIRGARITIHGPDDLAKLKWAPKLQPVRGTGLTVS